MSLDNNSDNAPAPKQKAWDRTKKYRGNAHYEEWHREYRNRPENKERMREYGRRPDRVAKRNIYNARPESKEARRLLNIARTEREYQKVPGLEPKPDDGLCQICAKEKKLYLDHDHDTGQFRGWICSSCNLALGKLGDRIKDIRNALRYFEHHEQRSYTAILACWKTGQITEYQWTQHLKDKRFAEWINQQGDKP